MGPARRRGEDAHAFEAIAVFVLLVTMFGIVVAAIAQGYEDMGRDEP